MEGAAPPQPHHPRATLVYDDRRERRSSRRDAKGQGLAVA
jgi:hypothetical protein